ncbi:MAG: MaoC family dehydratase [Acidimicrobiia bacterium]|nr:MaoC family dehydratase [Acidimicrobiia bacterium]
MAEFHSADELRAAVGSHLGHSGWLEITQERIDTFAEATGDHQWIHVDPARAAAGPFGRTIAHGYLVLALTNRFLPELFSVPGASMGLNYGVNKVRFPAPVPCGSRVRMASEVISADPAGSGLQVILRNTVELEGSDKPACVAESVSRFVF